MIQMLCDFLQDWVLNKLNGYFMILYANEYMKLAGMIAGFNETLVFFLVFTHLIPPRLRLP